MFLNACLLIRGLDCGMNLKEILTEPSMINYSLFIKKCKDLGPV